MAHRVPSWLLSLGEVRRMPVVQTKKSAPCGTSELALLALVIVTASCTHTTEGATAPQILDVQVAPVQQRDVPVYKEWIGTLDGFVNADIKAEVSGYLVDQAYTEGTFVSKGQLLFQIDP